MNLKLGWLFVSAITVLALFASAPPTLGSVRTHVVTMDGPVPPPSRLASPDGPVPPPPRVMAKDGPVPPPSRMAAKDGPVPPPSRRA